MSSAKRLKLAHELAQDVLVGKKTSTWRMYDDKNLAVNDQVVLIDQVDRARPQTWLAIGTARINKVIEKRLGDVQDGDFEGHNLYPSRQAMLEDFQKYYGDGVNWDTPLKIIHFDFTAGGTVEDNSEPQKTEHKPAVQQVILYADGGSRGNPGPSAGGYVIMDANEEVLVDKGLYLGITTNNQAEYQALKAGLEEARRMGVQVVDVRLDSLLVVNQMRGQFKVRNRELWPIHEAVRQLVGEFEQVSFRHVPRELNRLADAAVNRVLDEVDVSK